MSELTPYGRAVERLCRDLRLEPPGPYSQDWEHEIVAPDRLGDFLAAYETPGYGREEKLLLVELILGAANDTLDSGPLDPGAWDALRRLLAANAVLHRPTLEYWCLWQDEASRGEDDWFPITARLRGLYGELYGYGPHQG